MTRDIAPAGSNEYALASYQRGLENPVVPARLLGLVIVEDWCDTSDVPDELRGGDEAVRDYWSVRAYACWRVSRDAWCDPHGIPRGDGVPGGPVVFYVVVVAYEPQRPRFSRRS